MHLLQINRSTWTLTAEQPPCCQCMVGTCLGRRPHRRADRWLSQGQACRKPPGRREYCVSGSCWRGYQSFPGQQDKQGVARAQDEAGRNEDGAENPGGKVQSTACAKTPVSKGRPGLHRCLPQACPSVSPKSTLLPLNTTPPSPMPFLYLQLPR